MEEGVQATRRIDGRAAARRGKRKEREKKKVLEGVFVIRLRKGNEARLDWIGLDRKVGGGLGNMR